MLRKKSDSRDEERMQGILLHVHHDEKKVQKGQNQARRLDMFRTHRETATQNRLRSRQDARREKCTNSKTTPRRGTEHVGWMNTFSVIHKYTRIKQHKGHKQHCFLVMLKSNDPLKINSAYLTWVGFLYLSLSSHRYSY